jgi:hypothetical protein
MYQKRYAPRTSPTLLFHALTNYICANFTTLLQTDLVFLQVFFRGQTGEMSDGAGSGLYDDPQCVKASVVRVCVAWRCHG